MDISIDRHSKFYASIAIIYKCFIGSSKCWTIWSLRGGVEDLRKHFLQSLCSKKTQKHATWMAKKCIHSPKKLCLHHLPVRQNSCTNQFFHPPPQGSNGPPLSPLRWDTPPWMVWRKKVPNYEQWLINLTITYKTINTILEALNEDTQFSVINQLIFLSILST